MGPSKGVGTNLSTRGVVVCVPQRLYIFGSHRPRLAQLFNPYLINCLVEHSYSRWVIILTTVVMDTGIRLASSASTYTKRLLSPFHIPPPVLFHLEVSPVDYFVFVFVLLSYSLDKPLDKPFAITMPSPMSSPSFLVSYH
jgi:hypothetical protein